MKSMWGYRSQGLGKGVAVVGLGLVVACGSSSNGSGGDGGLDGTTSHETGSLTPTSTPPEASVDAFFATDPPPMYCGFDGGTPPPTPTGTLDCPSDKNREGCPCPTLGTSAACWPGLRVNRGLGQCKDGTTTCVQGSEGLTQAWGPCSGYVLPTPGATKGAPACKCFSGGRWQIDNLSPCFATAANSSIYAVSTYMNGSTIACPTDLSATPPNPQPGVPWSTDSLTVDCPGHYKLCYTLKAGSAASPKASDCVVASVCSEADYLTASTPQAFPPLPGWTSADSACATTFANSGGYGEMSVLGLSELCDKVDDGSGNPDVFNRVQYCPESCNTNPSGAGCANCMAGGSGGF